jgi:hypothetical protein
MPYYRTLGNIPPKRHTMHRVNPGYKGEGIYYEEVVTTQGFSRAYSIVYHLKPPTRVKEIRPPVAEARSHHWANSDLCECRCRDLALPARYAAGGAVSQCDGR